MQQHLTACSMYYVLDVFRAASSSNRLSIKAYLFPLIAMMAINKL